MTEAEKFFAKISEACATENLEIVMGQINKGQIPDRKEIILVLKGDKNIPRKLRDHIIEILEGRIKTKKPRGRPSLKEKNEYAYELRKIPIAIYKSNVESAYKILREKFPNQKDPKRTSIEIVAALEVGAKIDFSPDETVIFDPHDEPAIQKKANEIDRLIYRRNR